MITWEVSISNVKVAQKRANVSAVRTDSESGATETYSFKNAIIGTTSERQAILQQVWDNHLAYTDKQAAIDTFITNLEITAKTNLEGRE